MSTFTHTPSWFPTLTESRDSTFNSNLVPATRQHQRTPYMAESLAVSVQRCLTTVGLSNPHSYDIGVKDV